MKPRDKAVKALLNAGYEFDRHGKKHDMFRHPELQCSIPLKRHDFDESDLRYIEKEIRQHSKK